MSRAARSLSARAVRSLATHLPDRLVPPNHPDLNAARSVYFTGVDRRPAAIVRPRSAQEVALDLSAMAEVTVDPRARIAHAAGLATGFGDSPKLGIGGITQSGGIGFLHRRFSLTVDAFLGAEVVTAAGEVLEVDGERRLDLFSGRSGAGAEGSASSRAWTFGAIPWTG